MYRVSFKYHPGYCFNCLSKCLAVKQLNEILAKETIMGHPLYKMFSWKLWYYEVIVSRDDICTSRWDTATKAMILWRCCLSGWHLHFQERFRYQSYDTMNVLSLGKTSVLPGEIRLTELWYYEGIVSRGDICTSLRDMAIKAMILWMCCLSGLHLYFPERKITATWALWI